MIMLDHLEVICCISNVSPYFVFQKSTCVGCLCLPVVTTRPEYHQISVVLTVSVIRYQAGTSPALVTRDTLERDVMKVWRQ